MISTPDVVRRLRRIAVDLEAPFGPNDYIPAAIRDALDDLAALVADLERAA